MVHWLRLYAPNAGGLGSIPGKGTRSHMSQLRVCMMQLRPGGAKLNKYIFFKNNKMQQCLEIKNIMVKVHNIKFNILILFKCSCMLNHFSRVDSW